MKTFIAACFQYGSTCLPYKYLAFVSNVTHINKTVQLKLVLVGVNVSLSQITVVVKLIKTALLSLIIKTNYKMTCSVPNRFKSWAEMKTTLIIGKYFIPNLRGIKLIF